jgi:hypothetical protein
VRLTQVTPFARVDADLVGNSLNWFADFLGTSGKNWHEERKSVLADIMRG